MNQHVVTMLIRINRINYYLFLSSSFISNSLRNLLGTHYSTISLFLLDLPSQSKKIRVYYILKRKNIRTACSNESINERKNYFTKKIISVYFQLRLDFKNHSISFFVTLFFSYSNYCFRWNWKVVVLVIFSIILLIFCSLFCLSEYRNSLLQIMLSKSTINSMNSKAIGQFWTKQNNDMIQFDEGIK